MDDERKTKIWKEVYAVWKELHSDKLPGEMAASELARLWEVSYDRAKWIIDALVKEGILCCRHNGRVTYYSVNPDITDISSALKMAHERAAAASGKPRKSVQNS